MNTFGAKLKHLRTTHFLTQDQLADVLNSKYGTKINKSMLSKWENDKEDPRMEFVAHIASFFSVSLDYLLGLNITPKMMDYNTVDNKNLYDMRFHFSKDLCLPVGIPLNIISDIIKLENIEDHMLSQECIALHITDDSMSPRYNEDDIVIIKLQTDCESGKDALVYIDEYGSVLRKVIKSGSSQVILQPFNADYPPGVFSAAQIKIIGVAVQLRRNI